MGNLSTPITVQKLQTALHAKAKSEAGYRFYALYDKIYRSDILFHAWKLPPTALLWLAPEDTSLPLTTGSYRVVQFNAIQKQFVAFGNVPKPTNKILVTGCSWRRPGTPMQPFGLWVR